MDRAVQQVEHGTRYLSTSVCSRAIQVAIAKESGIRVEPVSAIEVGRVCTGS